MLKIDVSPFSLLRENLNLEMLTYEPESGVYSPVEIFRNLLTPRTEHDLPANCPLSWFDRAAYVWVNE